MALTKEQKAAIARVNGAKSRGPKTLEGKAISSQNALKTGLSALKKARNLILDGVENERDYQRFSAMMREAYKPTDAAQEVVVQRIVSLNWRLARVNREEALIIWEEGESRFLAKDPHYLIQNETRMDQLLRYEEKVSRELRLAESQLEKLQKRSSPLTSNNSSQISVTLGRQDFNE